MPSTFLDATLAIRPVHADPASQPLLQLSTDFDRPLAFFAESLPGFGPTRLTLTIRLDAEAIEDVANSAFRFAQALKLIRRAEALVEEAKARNEEEREQAVRIIHQISSAAVTGQSAALAAPENLMEHLVKSGADAHLQLVRDAMGGGRFLGLAVAFRRLKIQVSEPINVPFAHHGTGGGLPNIATRGLDAVANWSAWLLCAKRNVKTLIEDATGLLPARALTCLLGPRGSGKSLLLHAVAGKLRNGGVQQVHGTVHVGENHSLQDIPHPTSFMSLIEQNDKHNPKLRVGEVVEFAYALRGRDHLKSGLPVNDAELLATILKSRVDLSLCLCNLLTCKDMLVSELTDTQLKLLSLVEVIVANQKVVLLDDFSASLEARACVDVFRVLHGLSKFLNTTIAVSCTVVPFGVVDNFVDNMICLRAGGHVAFCGPVADLRVLMESAGLEKTSIGDAEFMSSLSDLQAAYEASPAFSTLSSPPPPPSPLPEPISLSSHVSSDYHHRAERWLLFEMPSYRRSWLEMFYKVLAQHRKTRADFHQRLFQRSTQTVCYALLLGAAFYQIKTFDNPFLVYMVVSILLNTLGSQQSKLHNVIYAQRATAHKFLAADYYPPSVYAAADLVSHLPYVLIESLISSVAVYLLSGLTLMDNGAHFFWFCFIVCYFALVSSQVVRCIDYAFDQSSLSGPFVVFYVLVVSQLFSGAVITPGQIPPWFIWVYWAFSLMQWPYTSLIQNEFYSSRYLSTPATVNNSCVAVSPVIIDVSCGAYFLQIRQMPTNPAFQYAAVGVLTAWFILLLLASVAFLERLRTDHLIQEPIVSERKETAAPLLPSSAMPPPVPLSATVPGTTPTPTTIEQQQQQQQERIASETDSRSSASGQGHLSLCFRNLFIRGELSHVSGLCREGESLALFGPDVPTRTLTKVLGQRKKANMGQIHWGTQVLSGSAATRALVGYVESHPDLGAGLSVAEVLSFQARMRGNSDATPLSAVASLLHRSVDLLAPWESRLVAVAMEVQADKRLIVVEAGSGEEDLLTHARGSGRVLVAALKHPRTLRGFSRALMLDDKGAIVFHGHTASLAAFFATYPTLRGLPTVEDVCVAVIDSDESSFGYARMFAASSLAQSNEASIRFEVWRAVALQSSRPRLSGNSADDKAAEIPLPVLHQLSQVWARTMLEYWRAEWMGLRLTLTTATSIVLSFALFQQTTNLNSSAAVESLVVGMSSLVTIAASLNGQQQLSAWIKRNSALKREVSLGCYPAWIGAVANVLADEAFVFVQIFLYGICFYVANGLGYNPGWLVVVFLALLIAVEGLCTHLGMCLTAWFGTPGTDATTLLLALFSLFAGIVVPGSSMPTWMLSLYYSSPFRWALEGMVSSQAEFDTQLFCNPSGNLTTWNTSSSKGAPSECFVKVEGTDYLACCSPASATPVTVQNYILNPVDGAWGTQPYGYQFAYLPWDLIFVIGAWVLIQVLFVLGVHWDN